MNDPLTSGECLAILRAKRERLTEAASLTVRRKLELTAAHERMVQARDAELVLRGEVDVSEAILLKAVEAESERVRV